MFLSTDNSAGNFRLRLKIGLILLIALLLAGCGSGPNDDGPNAGPQGNRALAKGSAPNKDNYIIANPNPVPGGSEPHGKTLISWSTKNIPPQNVHIYVSEEGGDENLFATGSEGSQEAPWIPFDSPIDFKLYSGEGPSRSLLDKVVVTRQR
jgi:hypothetical protein